MAFNYLYTESERKSAAVALDIEWCSVGRLTLQSLTVFQSILRQEAEPQVIHRHVSLNAR